MKIAIVNHPNNTGRYAFETPVGLKQGDVVQCDTARGNSIGVCLCDSIDLEGSALDVVLHQFGTGVVFMKKITGVYRLCKWADRTTVEENKT